MPAPVVARRLAIEMQEQIASGPSHHEEPQEGHDGQLCQQVRVNGRAVAEVFFASFLFGFPAIGPGWAIPSYPELTPRHGNEVAGPTEVGIRCNLLRGSIGITTG
jgi:hypothetical protein